MAMATEAPADPAMRAFSAKSLPALAALAGLVAGGIAAISGAHVVANLIWSAGTLVVLAVLLIEIVSSLRRGSVGLDLVAALSMAAAVAFGEGLPGNVVALMYAGGTLLEDFAEGRARREMMALLGRVARTAMLHRSGQLVETPIEAIRPDDRLLIRQGEVVPVDGTVAGESALLDQSALTGEGLPVQRRRGEDVMSGSTNVGDAFDLVATRTAALSTYPLDAELVKRPHHGHLSRPAHRQACDGCRSIRHALTSPGAASPWPPWTFDPYVPHLRCLGRVDRSLEPLHHRPRISNSCSILPSAG